MSTVIDMRNLEYPALLGLSFGLTLWLTNLVLIRSSRIYRMGQGNDFISLPNITAAKEKTPDRQQAIRGF